MKVPLFFTSCKGFFFFPTVITAWCQHS